MVAEIVVVSEIVEVPEIVLVPELVILIAEVEVTEVVTTLLNVLKK